jgi:hypothetical protein
MVSIVDDRVTVPGRGKGFFSLASVSRPLLGPTQPPVQLVPGTYLVPRSRMSRSYTSSPKRLEACGGRALALMYMYLHGKVKIDIR